MGNGLARTAAVVPAFSAETAAHDVSRSPAPYYRSIGNEERIFRAAFAAELPVMLKGPTGCGKTRLVEYMAHSLGCPLISVACNEDLTAADLVGRYLLKGAETVWEDGPLTRAVRQGAICYLDEIVEARADTIVVLHPLVDHRRELHVERRGETLKAPREFMLVVSFNPGYQSVLKDLKESTRQRMAAIDMGFPPPGVEADIIVTESGVGAEIAADLVKLAGAIRNLDVSGLPEVASTRSLVTAARLIRHGVEPSAAGLSAIAHALTDDREVTRGLAGMIDTYLSASRIR